MPVRGAGRTVRGLAVGICCWQILNRRPEKSDIYSRMGVNFCEDNKGAALWH